MLLWFFLVNFCGFVYYWYPVIVRCDFRNSVDSGEAFFETVLTPAEPPPARSDSAESIAPPACSDSAESNAPPARPDSTERIAPPARPDSTESRGVRTIARCGRSGLLEFWQRRPNSSWNMAATVAMPPIDSDLMSPALLLVDTSSACVKRFYAVGRTGGTEVREQTALCLDINGGPEETGGLFYQYSGAEYSSLFYYPGSGRFPNVASRIPVSGRIVGYRKGWISGKIYSYIG